jgi:hypothetical protein
MEVNWYVVIEVARAVAWPAVAAGALMTLRAPIGTFLEAIGHRATKIGAFNVTVELAQSTLRAVQLPELDPLKKDATQVQEPGSLAFFGFVGNNPILDVIVNLGAGQEWLTSRLFLVAAMLPRLSGLKCIVFCNGSSGRRFVGLAEAEAVRRSLARKYPHLERAYLAARMEVTGLSGYSGVAEANEIARRFLMHLRAAGPVPGAVGVDNAYWEQAAWLTPELLSDVLDEQLVTDAVRFRAAAPQDTVRELLVAESRFAALVTGNRTFHAVVDRYDLLQRAADAQLSA